MITTRHVTSKDDLTRYTGGVHPGYHSIVAEEAGKVVGFCWLADAGEALVGLYFTAEPHAVWTLANAVDQYASRAYYKVILTHSEPGRWMDVLNRRGWTHQDTPTYVGSIAVRRSAV